MTPQALYCWTTCNNMSTADTINTSSLDGKQLHPSTQDVVSHLAHELRQPLSAMESLSCYMELVLPQDDSRAHDQVAKLQDLLRQTNCILSDAVHYFRASSSHLVLMDWNETLMDIVADGDATAGVDANFELDDCIPPLLFDLEQAKHLALGMYLFLRKLSRGIGVVDIRSRRLDDALELKFSAAAPGACIDSDERIFEPFSPLAPCGAGLALASAKQIVQAHHGSIGIQMRDADLVVLSIRFPIQASSQAHISELT